MTIAALVISVLALVGTGVNLYGLRKMRQPKAKKIPKGSRVVTDWDGKVVRVFPADPQGLARLVRDGERKLKMRA